MDFSIGDRVKYRYPNPLNNHEEFFVGKIENISDAFIFIKNEKNIRLKISFKNFEFILPESQIIKFNGESSEMYTV